MSIAERIEQRMHMLSQKRGKKLSWSSMAVELGYSAQASTRWKKDIVSRETIQKIADLTNTNVDWILTGEGIADRMDIAKAIQIGRESIKRSEEKDQQFSAQFDKNISEIAIPLKGMKKVPLISYVQAGEFCEAIAQEASSYVVTYLEEISDCSFALEIKGNSMQPDFKEGDVIIVDTKVTPHPGDYVIAQNGNDEATFKKYKPRGYNAEGVEIFELEPLNPDYPILKSDIQKIRIIGTVVEHIRKLKRR
ncbi:S24 family peptidase [Acinetobacter sp. ANC 4641]|uniref:S24 family peptidase n=1 Tax=Acinetobacter sp. ANC 4641 TaxID=2529847 RepID=UPI001038B99B|nr:S24 family peptidase [Acinetobacter sp. ANC 4641]TCB12649.1 S24 family peptidase [Acinetobacter sp. ANC 4641]